jgi:predicted chitinase
MPRNKQSARKVTNADNTTPKAVASYCSVGAEASHCTDEELLKSVDTLTQTVPREVVEAAIDNAIKQMAPRPRSTLNKVLL